MRFPFSTLAPLPLQLRKVMLDYIHLYGGHLKDYEKEALVRTANNAPHMEDAIQVMYTKWEEKERPSFSGLVAQFIQNVIDAAYITQDVPRETFTDIAEADWELIALYQQKVAALRYCNHSKKRAQLKKQLKIIGGLLNENIGF